MSTVLAALSLVLAVVGVGISYSGYSESVKPVIITSTRTFTVTSTTVIATTSAESTVMTTSGTGSILSTVLDLSAPGPGHCGFYAYFDVTLDAGKVHVSYNSVTASGHIPTKVDFGMLTSDQWDEWEPPVPTYKYYQSTSPSCGDSYFVKSILQRTGSNALSTYEFTREIPSSGVYYFVFFNKAEEASITLVIDGGVGQSTVTVTSYHTLYSTHETQFPTQTETISSRPAGFGLLLSSGILLIVVAGVVLAISRWKRSAPSAAYRPYATPVGQAPEVVSLASPARHLDYLARLEELKIRGEVSEAIYVRLKDEYSKKFEGAAPIVSSPVQPPARRFCINCGAPLPAHATFCNKCGSKQ
jgi:hypothetical protein